MTFTEMHVEWSVTSADQLVADVLTVLAIKGQGLPHVRLNLKVPGWMSDLNAFLARKIRKFLSCLNKMSDGRENMCLVVRIVAEICYIISTFCCRGGIRVFSLDIAH